MVIIVATLFIVTFEFGFGPLMFIYSSEIFPERGKIKLVSLLWICNKITQAIVVITYSAVDFYTKNI